MTKKETKEKRDKIPSMSMEEMIKKGFMTQPQADEIMFGFQDKQSQDKDDE